MNPSLIQPGGFDDTIPISITHADGYENVDLLGDSPDIGQEMQERKGLKSSFGIVPGGTGAGVGEGALGAYVPEISMDDVDDVDGVATGNAKARH